MANDITLRELLGMDLSNSVRQEYNANADNKKISEITVSGNVIKGYSAFSFINEKTLAKQPERSSSGAMPDIQDIPSFVTPHLKIDFSLLFIDDYRTIMKLIYAQNEHIVTCYDVVEDKQVTNRMYFATEQMPKLYTLAKQLQGQNEPVVELLGVLDYTVELIGTNNSVDEITVRYNVNAPTGVSWANDTYKDVKYYQNEDVVIGEEAIITDKKDEKIQYIIPNLTFDNKYKFQYWCDNANGEGFKYNNGDIYRLGANQTLYAIWKAGAK